MNLSIGDRRFVVLLPVKPAAFGKSRLLGLGDPVRRGLVIGFAIDTATAALGSPLVAHVLAVTDDIEVADALHRLGAHVIPDGTVGDLNGSLAQAAADAQRRWPALGIAALCADLPSLASEDLTTALSRSLPDRAVFAADADREGTTLLVAPSRELFTPRFGARSRRAHLETGAQELWPCDAPGLRRDVDTPADLTAAIELGVGAHTASVVSRMGLGPVS